ncbi:hypothetical protein ACVXG7_04270 [Enterobacter hormaechei]
MLEGRDCLVVVMPTGGGDRAIRCPRWCLWPDGCSITSYFPDARRVDQLLANGVAAFLS